MTWKDKVETGLKKDARIRKDNLPESQVSPTTQAVDAEEASEAAATTDGMPPAPVEENDALGG